LDVDLFDHGFLHDYKGSIRQHPSLYSQFSCAWGRFRAWGETVGVDFPSMRDVKRRLPHPMWCEIVEVNTALTKEVLETATWQSHGHLLFPTARKAALRIHEWAYGSQSPEPDTLLIPARPFSLAPMPAWRIEYIVDVGLNPKRYTRETLHERLTFAAFKFDASVDFTCFVRTVLSETNAHFNSRWSRREDSIVDMFESILKGTDDMGREELARYKLLKYYPPAEHLLESEEDDHA